MRDSAAPKTINRRISSLSSFYKFQPGAAAELRLPVTVPNPAHAQFISRETSDPRDETRALSAARARQLMGMPSGDATAVGITHTSFAYGNGSFEFGLSESNGSSVPLILSPVGHSPEPLASGFAEQSNSAAGPH